MGSETVIQRAKRGEKLASWRTGHGSLALMSKRLTQGRRQGSPPANQLGIVAVTRDPESQATSDNASAGVRTRGARSHRARDEFPPSPKSVRTWNVPVAAVAEDGLVVPVDAPEPGATKSACKSQFAGLATAAVFLIVLAGFLIWLLVRATQE
jgi:hypothetical protein